MPVNLIKSLRPAQSLSPGLFKVYGLFIVDNGLVTVADHFSINGAVYRKFNILGQKMEGPASLFTDDFSGYQKPGAGNGTVGSQKHTGKVKEAGFAQKPQSISGRDPVGSEVFGIAVAGQSRIVAAVKCIVHFPYEIGIYIIIGIKYKVAVINILSGSGQTFKQIIQSVALSDQLAVKAAVYLGACL